MRVEKLQQVHNIQAFVTVLHIADYKGYSGELTIPKNKMIVPECN